MESQIDHLATTLGLSAPTVALDFDGPGSPSFTFTPALTLDGVGASVTFSTTLALSGTATAISYDAVPGYFFDSYSSIVSSTVHFATVPVYKLQTTPLLRYDALAEDVGSALRGLAGVCSVDVERSAAGNGTSRLLAVKMAPDSGSTTRGRSASGSSPNQPRPSRWVTGERPSYPRRSGMKPLSVQPMRPW